MYSGSDGTFDDEYIHYVLDTYSAMLIRLCYTYVKSMHDAEDIAQDVFCELIRRRPVFESSEHERAWFVRSAINKCKNHLKSFRVSRTVPITDDISRQLSDDGGVSDADSAVRDAVLSLPEKYRTVIHLFYYIGLSINEIAVIKRISAATVGTQLARARALLKKQLGDDF